MKKFAAFALAAFVGCAGYAAALDVQELQAKLAAQEAALNDIEAKMASDNGDAPEYMLSMDKNAEVTIGGLFTTSYFFQNGKQDLDEDDGAGYQRQRNIRTGSFEMSDNEIDVEINVNEHFDAYFNLDLNAVDDANGLAQSAWIRWKNICDSGFSFKVGRDDLVFGDGDASVGYLYNFTARNGDGNNWWFEEWEDDVSGLGLAPHNIWDQGAVTQIAPSWELMDGKLLLEASFFAHAWNDEEGGGAHYDGGDTLLTDGNRTRSRNYGLGSGSFRATWNPTENLHFSASVVNYHANGWDGNGWDKLAKNNTAVALSFTWRPACFDKLNIWSQYVHGWNVNHFSGADSDVVNAGVSYDLTDSLTVFAQGDYLRSAYSDFDSDPDYQYSYTTTAWAAYAGAMYDFGNGLSLEAGWRHEKATRKTDMSSNGREKEKAKTDTLYTALSFEF